MGGGIGKPERETETSAGTGGEKTEEVGLTAGETPGRGRKGRWTESREMLMK